jgi:hypothetical protein
MMMVVVMMMMMMMIIIIMYYDLMLEKSKWPMTREQRKVNTKKYENK